MEPRLSIIVCAFDEEARTEACLDSLFAQDLEPERFEITFVDDGSTDATEEIALRVFARHADAEGPTHRFVRIEHAGLCAARNTGLAHSRADLVAFVDADAIAEPDWARRLVDFFDSCPEAEVVGGRVHILNADHPTARRLDLWHYDASDRRCIIGCNMAFRRRVFERIGPFRTCFQSRGDETELLMRHGRPERVRKLPQARVHHERPESLRAWFRERRANGRFYAWGERLTAARPRRRLAHGIANRLVTLSPWIVWPLACLHPLGALALVPGLWGVVRRQARGRTQWLFHEARRRFGGMAAVGTTAAGLVVNVLGDWCSDVGYLQGALEHPGPRARRDPGPPAVVRRIEVAARASTPSVAAPIDTASV